MAFSDEDIKKIWLKGTSVIGEDPTYWRKDQCGAWVGWQFYGNRQSEYGWEIDHIDPEGRDDLSNLRPLQWTNNAERQEGKLTCPVIASGINNVRVRR